MQRIPIVIDETPYCVWDWDVGKLEDNFLAGIDPAYFEYMVKAITAASDEEDAQRAALALRMTYSHAQETLMSLLCAVVQAPQCVIGWLHKYRIDELVSVVQKLHRHQSVLTKLNWADLSWTGLSLLIHRSLALEDKEKEQRIKKEYGLFWGRIASDFLEEGGRREYNSIKHGLRARSGGFHLSIGEEKVPGTACPPEEMKCIGGSRFGTTFYAPETLQGVEKCNIKITSSSRNWLPDQLAARTYVISLSMKNILSFLAIAKGSDASNHQFVWPQEMSMFEAGWEGSVGVNASSWNLILESKHIQPMSKDEILDWYKPRASDEDAESDNTQEKAVTPPSAPEETG